jgi:MarR family transcriptional regulator, organic hydroperoxide resistance regulator
VREGLADDEPLGELLQEFVNRVSHLQGHTLTVLTEESVTLQQVLLLRRLHQMGESTLSDLAARMRMSPPAVSQMIDRLFALDLLTRVEAEEDRRRKKLGVTRKGQALLERVRRARAAEYAAGVSGLSTKVRADLLSVLRRALKELPHEADAVAAPATTQSKAS